MAQQHHRSPHFVAAGKRLRALGNANPHAVCWRDGLTLDQHRQRWPHRQHRWTAGHTIDGSTTWRTWTNITTTPPHGDWLALESSGCNYAGGAALTLGRTDTKPIADWF